MVYIPLDSVASIEVLMRLHEQSVETTYAAYHPSTPIDSVSLQNLAEVVLGWVTTVYFPLLSNLISCVGVKVVDLTTSSGGTYTAVPGSSLVGSIAQPAINNSLAFCIKHLTAARGRSYRGRSFVPGIPVTSLTDPNTLAVVLANELVDAFISLDGTIEDANWGAVVVSRRSGGLPRVAGVATPILNHAYSKLILSNQRRRAVGVGI